jgi:hypothetical protein
MLQDYLRYIFYLNSQIKVQVYAMTTEGKYNVMLMDLLGKSL